jgi:dTDP-4-dehydrorhamnose 3,5-epimerase-like enzyme
MALENVHMLEFQQHGDDRGHLVVIEELSDIPFTIKRVFYMYGSDPNVVRGRHANRKTEFVLINVSGHSKVKARDGLGNEVVFSLNRPHTGIYIPRMVWKEMFDFSADSVLLVLASEPFYAGEYIRSYDEFVKEVTDNA